MTRQATARFTDGLSAWLRSALPGVVIDAPDEERGRRDRVVRGRPDEDGRRLAETAGDRQKLVGGLAYRTVDVVDENQDLAHVSYPTFLR